MLKPRAIVPLFLLLAAVSPHQTLAETARSITVIGNAELLVVPDEVVLTLGIESMGSNVETTKRQNDSAMQSFLGLVDERDIPKERIATEHLNIRILRESRRGLEGGLTYLVRRQVVVTLDDISLFEDFLTSALGAGVNEVHSVAFRASEHREYRDEARKLALEAAREKAQAMAATLGQTIGLPLRIEEGASRVQSPYGLWESGRLGGPTSNAMLDVPAVDPGPVGPTPPGKLSMTAQVTVTFEMAD